MIKMSLDASASYNFFPLGLVYACGFRTRIPHAEWLHLNIILQCVHVKSMVFKISYLQLYKSDFHDQGVVGQVSFVIFSYEKIFQKFAYFMQIFQEIRKKSWIWTQYLANFQKIFMPNCSPSIFTYPYVLIRTYISKPEKNFFHRFFEVFWTEKKFFRIFSGKQSETLRNYFLIILSNFQLFSTKFAYFFIEKFKIFYQKIFRRVPS